MPKTRIFQSISMAVGDRITLNENATGHLFRVLKMTVDSNITLFNGDGFDYISKICAISKKEIKCEILEIIKNNTESTLQLHLGQGISRGKKMDLVLQKATELGVTDITPLMTKRTGVKLKVDKIDSKVAHWQKIIESACEQCGRATLPTLHQPAILQDWLGTLKSDEKILLHPNDNKNSLTTRAVNSVSLLVGPEGGLNEEEIKVVQQHGFKTISLGPRILRTETAPISAISILQSLYGDMAISKG